MNKIFKEILAEIVPTEEENRGVFQEIDSFVRKLNSVLKDARAIIGGSMAKGTWLRGVYDVDIFVQFPYRLADKSDKLSDMLEAFLKKKFRCVRLHGSRDYFQVKEGNLTYEIIPILQVNRASQAKNITDISPLHAKWVKKNVKDVNQVRLLKQFAKAQRVYGAESYLNGFSGYVLEILTACYSTFNKLAAAAAKWKPKTIIDMEKHHRNVMFEVNKSKLISPLILIDPVQAGRNTAASLSVEKYERFVAACQQFRKNPSLDFFKIKQPSRKELAKKGDKLLYLEVRAEAGKEDIVGCRLLKVFEYLRKKLEENEFQVREADWHYDKKTKAAMWYAVKPGKLPAKQKWEGPPLRVKEHVEAFKKKYKKTFTEGNRIYTTVKRKYTTPEELIRTEARGSYVKEKVLKVELQ